VVQDRASVARIRPIVLASLVPLLVAGCEVFFGIKESVSSGTGGTGGAGGTHGAGGAGGAGGTPAAGGTGGTGGTPVAQPFCPSNPGHFLCADFDEGSVVLNWTDQDQTGAAHVTSSLDTHAYVSAPASFGVTSEAATLSGCESSRVIKQFPSSATSIHVDFEFSGCDGAFTTEAGAQQFVAVDCTLDTPDGGPGTQYSIVNWSLRTSGYQLETFGADTAMDAGILSATLDAGVPEAGVFTHVHLDVTFGVAGSAQLLVDGLPAVTKTNVNTSCPSPRDKALAMGLFSCTELVACEARYDNVIVDIDPPDAQ
jgi:hypothetical protein